VQQYLRSAHSSSQDVHTAILKKAAPQVRQTFEKSCLVLFVSDIAFDVEVTITMTHQQFKKTTLFLFCRIRKGEQKEKINDVNPPHLLYHQRRLVKADWSTRTNSGNSCLVSIGPRASGGPGHARI